MEKLICDLLCIFCSQHMEGSYTADETKRWEAGQQRASLVLEFNIAGIQLSSNFV